MVRNTTTNISVFLFENFFLAFLYFIAGVISNKLINTLVIWPAIGIALAVILFKGKRLLPAVFVGSFLTSTEILGFNSTTIILCLAVGFQALTITWVGFYLIDKFLGIDNLLIDNKTIFLFLLLSGPISVFLPAVFIVGVEYGLELISSEKIFFTFLTEWLRGSIGIIIFTPLLLILLSKQTDYLRKTTVVIPLLLLFVLNAWLFNYTKSLDLSKSQDSFEQQAQLLHDSTIIRFDHLVSELQKIKAFIDITHGVNQHNFNHYSQYILANNVEKRFFAWAPLVTNKEEFELSTNMVVFGIGPPYFPIQYISSNTEFQFLTGVNVESSNRWKVRFDQTLQNSKAKVVLLKKINSIGEEQKALAVVLPVYQKTKLRGYVITLLSFQSVIDKIIKNTKSQEINLEISSLGSFDKDKLVTDNFQYNRSFSTLQFAYSPNKSFYRAEGLLSRDFIFIFGLGLTGLMGFLLLSGTGQIIKIKKQIKEKSRTLNIERNLLETVINNVQEGIVAYDKSGVLTVFNHAADNILEGVLQRKSFEALIEEVNLSDLDGNSVLPQGEDFLDKVKERIKNAELSVSTVKFKKTLRVNSHPIKGENNRFNGFVISFQDITSTKEYTNELKKLSWAVEFCPVCIVITDVKGNIEYINKKFASVTGYTLPEIKGKIPRIMSSENIPKEKHKLLWDTILAGNEWRDELYNKKKNGVHYWCSLTIASIKDENQIITHFVSIQEDITEEKEATKILSHQASHDALTGLLNRRECVRRLKKVIENTRIHHSKHVFCFLDLDKFKIVNDSCGHLAGDHLLRDVCGIFQNELRQRDTLVRLGGDEFGILLEHCTLDQAKVLTDKICQAVADYDFIWEGQQFNIGVSAGLSNIDRDTLDYVSVIARADEACYVAKRAGRGRVVSLHPKKAN